MNSTEFKLIFPNIEIMKVILILKKIFKKFINFLKKKLSKILFIDLRN